MGIAMMAFLHLYMKFTQPLFIQALMGIKGLYDAKPVHIHILGKPAEGDLKRPFKAGGGLFGGMCSSCLQICPNNDDCVADAGAPKTDKAAIEEAEKRIGKKEE